MNDFHFIRPYSLFLLIPLACLLLALWSQKGKGSSWTKYCAKHLIPFVIKQKKERSSIGFLFFAIMSTLLIFSLAGPSWEQIALPLAKSTSDLVIALDLSPSMLAEDIKPSRYKRALYKIEDLLAKRSEGQTALIVFTDEAYVVSPLTTDTKTIVSLLSAIDPSIMPTHGLKHQAAIDKAAELLSQAGTTKNGKVLLLTADSTLFSTDAKIAVSVLGVGTEQGAPIPRGEMGFVKDSKGNVVITKVDIANLGKQAKASGGIFSLITADDADLQSILSCLKTSEMTNAADASIYKKDKDMGVWLVLLALPLAAFILRQGGYLTLFLLFFSTNLNASLWDSADQKAMKAFNKGSYLEASHGFDNPKWKAASLYKGGMYKEAAALYKEDESADGYYNLGNALAKDGQIDEAIVAYTKALEIDPKAEDAAYNKSLLEKQKEPPPPKDDKNKKNEDKGKDDSEKGDGGKDDKSNNEEPSNEGANDKKDEGKDNASKDKPNDSNEQNKSDQQVKDSSQSKGDQKQSKNGQDQEGDKEDISQKDEKSFKDDLDKALDKNSKGQNQEQKDQEAIDLKQKALESAQNEKDEQQEMDDRQLQRIKDDPGALLRRKFQYQYKRQLQKQS